MNIIITGASSGIGFETALEFSLHPANKILCLARSAEKLKQLHEIAIGLSPGCQLFPLVFDVVYGDYKQLISFISEQLGQVDILINNAGMLINKPFTETTETDLEEMLHANVISHFKITKAVLPFMAKGSHIVNIGSMGGFQGSVKFKGLAAYSVSKSALHTLTECMALELAEHEISVNCLALGSVQTEMLAAAFPGYQSPVMAFEMGKYIADFAKTGHKFFNGKTLPVAVTTP